MKKLRKILLDGCVLSAYLMPWLTLGEGHHRRGTLIVRRSKVLFGGQYVDADEVVR